MRLPLALTGVAALVVALSAAPGPAAASAPGKACFWSEPGQGGGSWCYTPGGYAEAAPPVQRHARSFDNRSGGSVYAIHFGDRGCLHRELRTDDYDDDWTAWATLLDGVSDTTMGCAQG
ncbi:hypothetical protein [Streptomyces genisteinicus]|uniref:Peptidase inhibitor family I36 protein n=1 Tax=Streptomyces genisteinicus TaxID=2768068 RepID=A0A7H0I1U7_9ACTN|nr:hypothetical protein [Streptomyces genisteinicus]QNP66763.1 hypothetical protein IAG43_30135 [Streptomyces genisteinicus]